MTKVIHLVREDKCSLPWLHLEVDLQNDSVKPCCKYTTNVGTAGEGVDTAWTGGAMKHLRTTTEAGMMPDQCKACDKPAHEFTYKRWKNEAYSKGPTLNALDSDDPQLRVLHLSLGSVCNFACRMCHPSSSSKLSASVEKSVALKRLFKHDVADRKDAVSIYSLMPVMPELQHVTVSGGEPLINDETTRLVSLLAERAPKLRTINFSTNFSSVREDLLHALSNLHHVDVTFSVSIDGPAHVQEYIRHGAIWSEMEENFRWLTMDHPRIGFAVNTTISALNAPYLVEHIHSLGRLQAEQRFQFKHMMVSPVLEPHVHAGVLPEKLKRSTLKRYSKMEYLPRLPGMERLLSTASGLMDVDLSYMYPKFYDFVVEMDKVHGTRIDVRLPEFAPWFMSVPTEL